MKNYGNLWGFFLISLIIILGACKKDSETPLPEPEFLIKAELIQEVTATQIRTEASNTPGFPAQLAILFTNDIKVYKITYKTPDVDGSIIEASGALLLPKSTNSFALVSLQHGTLQDPNEETDAPSYFSANSESRIPGALFASAGYAVVLPDYIGYGASAAKTHPYEHAQSLATASRDMLQAAREFCERNQVNLNSKLFLAGYSEGGYATMALLKHLQDTPVEGLKVTACAPGAGAYDKTAFARYVINHENELEFLANYLWVMDTYNRVYNINRPLNQIFNEPYATTISQNGVFASDISKNPQVLFKTEFIKGVVNATDTQFINAFAQNDLFDWKPTTPLNLFHGTADNFVLFFNSQNAFEAMKARGATNVILSPLEGTEHRAMAVPYYLQVFLYFSQF